MVNGRPLAVEVALACMGNPHAVLVVNDVDAAPVAALGAAVQALPCFPAGVNVSFVQVVGRNHVRLRVYERGGMLHIGWSGDNAPVLLTGPAVTVYRGEIELPNPLPALPQESFQESPP